MKISQFMGLYPKTVFGGKFIALKNHLLVSVVVKCEGSGVKLPWFES